MLPVEIPSRPMACSPCYPALGLLVQCLMQKRSSQQDLYYLILSTNQLGSPGECGALFSLGQ